jgi:hypothetical protein
MKLFFSLNQNLECSKLCKEITKAINQYTQNNNLNDTVMIIELKESTENKKICKLEYSP